MTKQSKPPGRKPLLLIFSANSSESKFLELSEEVEKIREGLRHFQSPIDFEHYGATTPVRLQRGLLEHSPTYVHFCGHGFGQGGLVLTNDQGRQAHVTAEALGALFELFKKTVQCVVLNACYSEIQARAIVEHIDYVVGMSAAIDDADAIKFSVAFYEALAAGTTIPAAFKSGCVAIQLDPSFGPPHRLRDAIPEQATVQSHSSGTAHLIPELFRRRETRRQSTARTSPKADPRRRDSIESMQDLRSALRIASKPSLTRAQVRLELFSADDIRRHKAIQPIIRSDTGPDVRAFLASSRPLQLILGDSGYGKSTLLYQIATSGLKDISVSTLFYDIHQVEEAGSLRKRLALDLHCSTDELEDGLTRIADLLPPERGRILILVDAINEARHAHPTQFRYEIDSLAHSFPPRLKLIYSCRKVSWSVFLEGEQVLPGELYFGSAPFNLFRYSLGECAQAFDHYKETYRLTGAFSELPAELQEKLRDPLMLRMLSEGYAGRRLPTFAPAVLVFKAYKARLARRFAATHVMDFLDALVSHKADSLLGDGKEVVYGDQLVERVLLEDIQIARLHFAQLNSPSKPSKPLLLLEDEGVLQSLDEARTRFRFRYDRFYEYLLGETIGPRLLNETDPAQFRASLERHLGTVLQSELALWQALKSELVRRNLEPNEEASSLYTPAGLLGLVGRQSGAVGDFTRELLRELVFEARPAFAKRLQEVLGDDERWDDLLLDIAPDSVRMLPTLAHALLSGEKHRARRASHSIARFSSSGEAHERFEALVRDSLATRLRERGGHRGSLRGLVYYSAVLFAVQVNRGADPGPHLVKLWQTVLQALPLDNCAKRRFVASELWDVIQAEGPQFFSGESRQDGMEYVWEVLDANLKVRSLEMARCLVESPPSLPHNVLETIRFFAAEQRHWHLRGRPEEDEVYGYKLEFDFARWLLIYWSRRNYPEIAQILQTLVDTDYWLNIDFALCTMEFILKHNYARDRGILEHGFDLMKSWTNHFEENLAEQFYLTLGEPDPFSLNYIPVAQLVGVDAAFFTPDTGPISTLEERFMGDDPRALRLSLLATRYLWGEHPQKVLGSLRLLLTNKDSDICEWLDRILREIYMVYPRLVERFLSEHEVDQGRSVLIKHKSNVQDPSGFRHDVDALMRFLFLESDRLRRLTVEWYGRLLSSPSPQHFLEELVSSLLPDSESG